jgi:chemosensory pili system protein ChpA (sensor histidine kinase/response regulator)
MTPLSSPPAQTNSFDTGSLSWVMIEITEALNRSRALVDEALKHDPEAQATALRQARAYLHQAHGALQIVDIDGVSVLTDAIEKMLDCALEGKPAFSEAMAQSYGSACIAIVEYLEELLAGALHQPVRLFPYYKLVLQVCGNDKAHPSDLFFPDTAIHPQLPAAGNTALAVDFASVRQRFERALLPFLRSTDAAGERLAASGMAALVAEVERAQASPDARRFWWVLRGFVEGVASGDIPVEIYVKQLFGRINLQFRRLADGAQGAVDRLARDALFFIAACPRASGRTAQVRNAYRLEGQVPEDYERKRYGQVDSVLLAAARASLNDAKNSWGRLVNGDDTVGAQFEKSMQALAEAGARLHAPSLEKLLRELNGIARAAHTKPGQALALEMAGSLLFVENALNHTSRLSESFAGRAEALTARLLSVMAGHQQEFGQIQWLDDMSRDAQQKETVAVLAGEMRISLNQVEKGLEEFFEDCTQRGALPVVDSTLHQIEGALSILDQEQARQAIVDTRAAVARFAALPLPQAAAPAESQRVARNLGALSFYLEALQKQPGAAGERFDFDPATGIFQGRLIDTDRHAQLDVVVDPLPDLPDTGNTAPASLPGLPPVPAIAMPVIEPAIAIAMAVADEESPPALSSLPSLDPASVQSEAAPSATSSADPDFDAELLEIFLGEAGEVLECVRATLPLLEAQPAHDAHLVTLRRSFHTLKGSGRMVGLAALGDAAWSIEQVLNLRLADGTAATPPLIALLHAAATLLEGWVADLRATGTSDCRPDALVAGAKRVKDGENFSIDGDAAMASATEASLPPADFSIYASLDQAGTLTIDEEIVASLPMTDQAAEDVATGDEQEAGLPVLSFGTGESADSSVSFSTSDTEPDGAAGVAIDGADTGIQLLEDAAGNVRSAFSLDALSGPEVPFVLDESADHTLSIPVQEQASDDLAGSALAGDWILLANSEPPAESELASLAPVKPPAAPADSGARVIDLAASRATERRVDDNIKRVGSLELSLPLYNIYLAETDDLVRLLAHDFAEWRHEPERAVHSSSVTAAHSLSGSSATVGFAAVHELAHALEMILQSLARRPVQLMASDFLLMQQAVERAKGMLALFAQGDLPEPDPSLVSALEGRLADIMMRPGIGTGMHEDEPADAAMSAAAGTADGLPDPVGRAGPQESSALIDFAELTELIGISGQDEPASDVAGPAPAAWPNAGLGQARPAGSGVTAQLLQNDELDTDLLPIFLEEGRDMLPQIDRELRGWQASPAEAGHSPALLRLLHTIKGSARMAGAMNFGQHMHEMESSIEHICSLGTPGREAIDDLLGRLDLALFMFDRLQNPPAAASSVALLAQAQALGQPGATQPPVVFNASLPTDGLVPMPSSPELTVRRAADAPAPVSAAPLVRVRADVLDRLVNQAGEVSIARSRAETEVGGLRQSLADLTENVSRLRSQLREIEIQAESQMTSQMASSTEREFDPLEFDRFTRLQELTRMMAESVNDVASLQSTLSRSLDNTDAALDSQARLTRELQQDLMRVRMVQFASISERLYRVTRQTAKEVDKRVNLDVRGGSVEIDRGVLEKMAGPFEHLLRNAIVHGIESRAARAQVGKSEIGEIQLEVRQEGNEVVIQFSDDGGGLDLARIRSKAQAVGLLANDAQPADAELRDLIFHPGFTTASEVTALAGRGVGMDVVRSEVASLGGRIEVQSDTGQGARFLIRLPLTLAVTQVVLLSAGGKIFGVPSVLVEQVQQLKSGALASAYNAGAVVWQGQQVTLHYLPSLLGDASSVPVTQQYSPLMILRSGNDRVAIHVDEVIGNREVVVKNIGPQLSRLVGIAGATVLGTGDIVLILNPVPLAQRAATSALRAPRPGHAQAPGDMGAVAEMGLDETARTESVQGLRSQTIVMVVDDSLTVRRVTQRLLAREGYQVVLAKDGIDALEQLQSITPDIMLLDIEMPRMDGFDLARNVRSDERTRQVPIIMITSRTAAKHRNYATELGVNEYVGKPYQEAELLALVKGLVEHQAPAG